MVEHSIEVGPVSDVILMKLEGGKTLIKESLVSSRLNRFQVLRRCQPVPQSLNLSCFCLCMIQRVELSQRAKATLQVIDDCPWGESFRSVSTLSGTKKNVMVDDGLILCRIGEVGFLSCRQISQIQAAEQ